MWRKLFGRKEKVVIQVQKIYIDQRNDIKFFYYDGNNYHSALNFIEQFAPKYRHQFTIGGVYGVTGIKLKDKQLLKPDVYLVVVKNKLKILDVECINTLYDTDKIKI